MKWTESEFEMGFWNLGGLQLRGILMATGRLLLLPVDPALGAITSISILQNGDVVLLRREARLIQRIPYDKIRQNPSQSSKERSNIRVAPENEALSLYQWSNDEDIIDLVSHGNKVYFLDILQNSINSIELNGDSKVAVERRSLTTYRLSHQSRIAIASCDDTQATSVYVSSASDHSNKILHITFEKPLKVREIAVTLNEDSYVEQNLGEELNLHADMRKQSLLVSDTLNNRVLEVEGETGYAEVICGRDETTLTSNDDEKNLNILHSPRSVVIYRPAEVIDKGFFSTQALVTLDVDASGTRPRMILIADSGNGYVKNLIELPVARSLGPDSGKRDLRILAGFRRDSHKNISQLIRKLEKHLNEGWETDLKDIIGMAVSPYGELLLQTASCSFLILLQPATAVANQAAFEKAAHNNADVT